ncbi:hypothetical protein BKA81DRAFT_219646 [Phyllosticta paracitricarpa]
MPHSDLGTTFNWEDEDAGHGTERSSMAHSGGVSFTCWFRNFAALYTAGARLAARLKTNRSDTMHHARTFTKKQKRSETEREFGVHLSTFNLSIGSILDHVLLPYLHCEDFFNHSPTSAYHVLQTCVAQRSYPASQPASQPTTFHRSCSCHARLPA